MNQSAYALLGLTAIVAALVSVVIFALLRFGAAARDTKRHLREGGAETTLLSAALQEAVTKLKAQEREMSARAEASEHLSGQIVDSVTAGLLLVDRAGRIEILNPAGRALLGVTRDPVGAEFHDLLASAAPLADAIAECLATGKPVVRRLLGMPETSGVSHLGVTVSPVGPAGAPSGSPQGAICLFSNLTAVVELEEQLRLKEALAQLGELTAGIAHEFRNGLATIHGYSRLIDLQELPERYRPYVQGIREETDLLGRMVTNFLGFARPEQTSFGPVALDAIARRAAADLRHELPDAARVEVSGTWAPIEGDEVLLRQMFGNLIRNAVEACQTAGTSALVEIRGEVDAGQGVCRVSVDDNGPGIPEASRTRVFQPFVTTRSRGTGLGLAIVQKIVVLHNGRVAIRSTPQGGTSVQLAFGTNPEALRRPRSG